MAKRLMKEVIGKRVFGDTVDATDPCYKKDVWCRMNGIKIVPGEYECVAWMSDEGEWGNRVAIIGIYLGGYVPPKKQMWKIGSIGVDAGLAGFFENKPDYDNDQWEEFCQKVNKPEDHAWIFPEGFFSSSGYGDGAYDVSARKIGDGRATALEIRFI